MSVKNKTLAKALHTITVLANVAEYIAEVNGRKPDKRDVKAALRVLGYGDAADPLELADKAAAILAARK